MSRPTPSQPSSDSGRSATGAALCFGEMLWDMLPHGSFPGGAPFNVACHLRQLGVPVVPVSAVGADPLGDRLLELVRARGLDDSAVSRIQELPTGTVTASISPSGDARYAIATGVAWDRIPVDVAISRHAPTARALVFGSLALRTAANQDALARLAAATPQSALKVFDVNLRPPFDDLALVRRHAHLAGLLKLNAEEAARLAGKAPETSGQEEAHARQLQASTGVALVCVTSGDRGAGLLRAGVWTWEPARKVRVVDTVGAGDAFLARLLAGLLRGGASDTDLLAAACRRGEWVASQPGACPDAPPEGTLP